jgi:hypothetical protein
MAKRTNSSPKAASGDQIRLENIRQRAYELYEARGREEGRDIDNWLQAEAEIEAVEARKGKTKP